MERIESVAIVSGKGENSDKLFIIGVNARLELDAGESKRLSPEAQILSERLCVDYIEN